MPDLLSPQECCDALLPQLQALMEHICELPTYTPGLAFSMLYGLFVFTMRTFASAGQPISPEALAQLLVEGDAAVNTYAETMLH